MRRAAAAAAAVTWLAVVPAAPAREAAGTGAATPWVVTTVATRYVPADLTIAPGDTLTLLNLENAPHDGGSDGVGSDGRPLFRSATLYRAGQAAPVNGVAALETGAYGFYCSVHTEMRGSIVVA